MALFEQKSPLLPQLISWQGKWSANKTAVIFNHRRTSYKRFDQVTNQVANYLLANNIGAQSRVVVMMENSDTMLFALFGVIKSGATVVPLNLSISDEAVAVQIDDCDADCIIASSPQSVRLDGLIAQGKLNANRLLIAPQPQNARWYDWQELIVEASDGDPGVLVTDNDECNIIYSSGTTGAPKGILHGHRARLDWAYDLVPALRINSDTLSICSLGLYSNISWVSLLCNLVAGGCVLIQEKFNSEEFCQLVKRYQVNHCAGVPIQFQRILDSKDYNSEQLKSLRTIMSCGSPLSTAMKIRLARNLSADLIELYGLTEGVITTLAPEDASKYSDSVGKPLVGSSLRILKDNDELAEQGEVGEIIVRGRFLMSGYLGKPEADREASWRDQDGNIWLRTGDIGRINSEGFLYLVDRKKDMIISGGQNIYPQDLERVLLRQPGVAEAAVIAVPSDKWGETPLGLVVMNEDSTDERDILEQSNRELGKQQKISRVVIVQSLPRNPNGKIEKKRLREIYSKF